MVKYLAKILLLFLTSHVGPSPVQGNDDGGIYPHLLHHNHSSISSNSHDTCSLYLAPSSIPHSGFGVYTTRDIARGEYINRFLDAPSIPIMDKGNALRTHRNYVWGGNLFTENEADHVSVSVPNWSSHCNYHTYLTNFKHDKGFYNDSMVDRFTDPSAGSFSYHKGFYYKATRKIKAGEELFANYGEKWLDYREGTYADLVPREEEFETGGKILHKLFQFKEEEESAVEDVQLSRIQSIVQVMNKRVASLLPVTTDELNDLEKLPYPSDLDPMAARLATSTILYKQQKIDWIFENGICMDHVRAGPSTIPLAGQGGFATRFLPKGTLITPAPLLHVMDTHDYISTQLLVNYCFGHERSSILFCPMSTLTLLNHCSTRVPQAVGSCDPAKGPNAEIRWAADWFPSNEKWLNMTLSELHEMYVREKNGLAFDVFALRDIQPDEEIFIDYGKQWEDAWERHVQIWQPPDNDGYTFQSLTSFLEEEHEPRTVSDLTNDPYPQSIIQVCYFDTSKAEMYGRSGSGYDLIIEDGSVFTPVRPLIYEDYVYQCDMLRKNNDGTCTVVVVPSLDNENTVLIKKYPLAAITFRQKPYSSDQHLKNAFRHYISISDKIFPEHWLSSEKSSDGESSDMNECSLYLAPSSIPNAGYGVFTTRSIMPEQSIAVEDSPTIIVSDSTAHNNGHEVVWSVVDYAWTGQSDDMILSFNIGALANYHTVLNNMKPHAITEGSQDDASKSTEDPSRNAYTIERGYNFLATKAIFPGEEIFADYGERWLETRPDSFADHIPRYNHYDDAVAVLKTIQKDSKIGFSLNDTTYSLLLNTVKMLKPLVAQTLPNTVSDVYESMGADDPDIIRNKLAKQSINKAQHTVKWVKQNGMCIDNIIPGKSTVPLAGQGAFAARFLAKDSLISPAPLVQIPDRNSLLMYELVDSGDGEKFVRKNDTPIGSQLLLNYCFGHKDSRLLLYPLTNVILINHCSSRKAGEGDCGTKGPNAKVQWAESWESRNAEWLNKNPEEIYQLTAVGMRGLSFDIVATREIQHGEEIFIDYGVDWENAWEEHLRSWEPPSSPEKTPDLSPLDAGELDVRTLNEQLTNPYPENIITLCYYDLEAEWVNATYRGNEYHADGAIYEVKGGGDIQSSDSLYACQILAKQEDGILTVRILALEDYIETPVVLRNYPVSSVTFRLRKQSSDLHHLSGAFRHFIGIDDAMFPSQWKE